MSHWGTQITCTSHIAQIILGRYNEVLVNIKRVIIISIVISCLMICAYGDENMLVIDDKSIILVHILNLDSKETFKKVPRQKILNQALVYTDGL